MQLKNLENLLKQGAIKDGGEPKLQHGNSVRDLNAA